MKKTEKLIFIIVFFVICLAPVFTMPFFKVYNNSKSENRSSATLPKVIADNSLNLKFSEEFDSYLNDNFNFRILLSSLNSKIFENVFSVSTNEKVIVGKDDWLYYSKTLDSYTGTNVLSDTEINQISKVLSMISDYVTSCDKEFIFTIAPNKNSVYPNNMPKNYPASALASNAQKLDEVIDENIYCNLFEILKNSEQTSYLTRDSHWNNYGAYLGFEKIIQNLGLKQNFEIKNTKTQNNFKSDLDGMLYPNTGVLDQQIYYEFDGSYEFVSRFKSTDDLIIQTKSENGKGSALLFRDSFGAALLDFFALQFENCELNRVIPYDLSSCENYDYIILEIVERNIPNLLKNAPKMPAQIFNATNNLTEQEAEIFVDESGDYSHVYGYFKGETNDIYICVNDIYYSAFPITESKLNLDINGSQGFSAYLPKDIKTQDIKVLTERKSSK